MKVAIVHYWLVGMRGGERVLEALCKMYPSADIFTHVAIPERLSKTIRQHEIKTSFISRMPRSCQWYKLYLPLMPMALEELDLRGYDLIISSESGPAKGIIPQPYASHICYCHSPMRYVWNMYHDYRENSGIVAKLSMPWLTHYLRSWDQSCASRVDRFVANSNAVAARIKKYYRRDSAIVHPPVAIDKFCPVPQSEIGDFYLMVGELVRYKRADLAVRAFNKLGKRLVVIGGGELFGEVKRLAGPTVEVVGPQPSKRLAAYYARCKALVFPGEEDFGIVPVEAMASGRPVIAYGVGGVLDTIIEGVTGLFFRESSEEALIDAVTRFERFTYDSKVIRAHAEKFDFQYFQSGMRAVIEAEISATTRDSAATISPSASLEERSTDINDAPLAGPRSATPVEVNQVE